MDLQEKDDEKTCEHCSELKMQVTELKQQVIDLRKRS